MPPGPVPRLKQSVFVEIPAVVPARSAGRGVALSSVACCQANGPPIESNLNFEVIARLHENAIW